MFKIVPNLSNQQIKMNQILNSFYALQNLVLFIHILQNKIDRNENNFGFKNLPFRIKMDVDMQSKVCFE